MFSCISYFPSVFPTFPFLCILDFLLSHLFTFPQPNSRFFFSLPFYPFGLKTIVSYPFARLGFRFLIWLVNGVFETKLQNEWPKSFANNFLLFNSQFTAPLYKEADGIKLDFIIWQTCNQCKFVYGFLLFLDFLLLFLLCSQPLNYIARKWACMWHKKKKNLLKYNKIKILWKCIFYCFTAFIALIFLSFFFSSAPSLPFTILSSSTRPLHQTDRIKSQYYHYPILVTTTITFYLFIFFFIFLFSSWTFVSTKLFSRIFVSLYNNSCHCEFSSIQSQTYTHSHTKQQW